LVKRHALNPQRSRDSNYINAQDGRAIYRIRIADGKVEPVASRNDLRRADITSFGFRSLAPDDSPVVGVWYGVADLYAVEWEAP
jgi:hypothetical protein